MVDVSVLNQKPNRVAGGVITRYFYDGVNLGVQPEAAHLRATAGRRAACRVTSASRKDFRLVTVQFGQQPVLRRHGPLPPGVRPPGRRAPLRRATSASGRRSRRSSPGRSATRGRVRIEVPKAFDRRHLRRGRCTSRTTGDTQVFTATTDDSLGWYAWVNARNDDGLTRERLDLADGEQIVVRGWPEDSRWRKRVTSILSESVPGPRRPDRAPVAGRRPAQRARGPHAAARGLCRLLRPQERRDHDQREPRRPDDRPRGLARLVQQPAVRRPLDQRGAGRGVRVAGARRRRRAARSTRRRSSGPRRPRSRSRNWAPPAPIRDPQSDAREQYGYDAAWTVIRAILDEAGEDGMRRVFRAADAGTTAYPGDGAPEHTRPAQRLAPLPRPGRGAGRRDRRRGPAQDLGSPRARCRPARRPRGGARRLRRARRRRGRLDRAAGRAPGARRLGVRRGERPHRRRARDPAPARRDRHRGGGQRARSARRPRGGLRIRGHPDRSRRGRRARRQHAGLAAPASWPPRPPPPRRATGSPTSASAARIPTATSPRPGRHGRPATWARRTNGRPTPPGRSPWPPRRAAAARSSSAVARRSPSCWCSSLVAVWLVRRRQGNRRRRAVAAAPVDARRAPWPEAVGVRRRAGRAVANRSTPLDAGDSTEPPGPPPPPSP